MLSDLPRSGNWTELEKSQEDKGEVPQGHGTSPTGGGSQAPALTHVHVPAHTAGSRETGTDREGRVGGQVAPRGGEGAWRESRRGRTVMEKDREGRHPTGSGEAGERRGGASFTPAPRGSAACREHWEVWGQWAARLGGAGRPCGRREAAGADLSRIKRIWFLGHLLGRQGLCLCGGGMGSLGHTQRADSHPPTPTPHCHLRDPPGALPRGFAVGV